MGKYSQCTHCAMAAVRHHYYLLYLQPEAAQRADRLRRTLRRRDQGPGYPMPPDRTHITLQPMGCSDAQHEVDLSLAMKVGDAIEYGPFDVSFDRLESSGTHLELCGSGAGLRELKRFQRGLAEALGRHGVPEGQLRTHFRPHITLDYQHPWVPARVVAPISWRVEHLWLVDSLQGQGRHRVIKRWSLATRQSAFEGW